MRAHQAWVACSSRPAEGEGGVGECERNGGRETSNPPTTRGGQNGAEAGAGRPRKCETLKHSKRAGGLGNLLLCILYWLNIFSFYAGIVSEV